MKYQKLIFMTSAYSFSFYIAHLTTKYTGYVRRPIIK